MSLCAAFALLMFLRFDNSRQRENREKYAIMMILTAANPITQISISYNQVTLICLFFQHWCHIAAGFHQKFFPAVPFAKIIKLVSENIFTGEYCTYFAGEKTEFCNCCRETYLIYFPWNAANFLTVLPVGATWNSNGNFTLDNGRGQIVRPPDKWKNAAFDIVVRQWRFQSDSNWIARTKLTGNAVENDKWLV